MIFKKALLALAVGVALTGCAGMQGVFGKGGDKNKPAAPPLPAASKVDEELRISQQRTNRLLADMVSTDAARRGVREVPRPQPAGVLASTVTISWHSHVEGILSQIANLIGYRFKIFGKPALPVLVSIETKNLPLMDVLENIGVQAGNRADVIFNEHDKVIELRYAQPAS